tara:strand:+ start:115 stop:543 length:429 start_codon:yes stop_codon:yes gene_type:complete
MRNQEKLLTEGIIETKVDLLFAITEELLGVSEQAIKSKLRDRDIALARNILGYMFNMELRITVKKSGELINRDHSTICHYTRTFEGNYNYYPDFREQYTLISETFWSNYHGAERQDIGLQVLSLQNLINKLEARKLNLTKMY